MSSPDPEAPSDAPQADDPSPQTPNAPVRKALTPYRILAWTTGLWLIALCYEVVLKYVVKVQDPPSWIGVVHGWVYFAYLLTALNLAVKVRWPIGKTIGVLLAGTIPFLGIIVEHFQTKQIKAAFNL
jgi:integral membrane protein